jgi:starch synthase
MSISLKTIWLVTREYAGIAEAGGVKNVVCSLAEGLARAGLSVTVFMPRYGFSACEGERLFTAEIAIAGESYEVVFSALTIHGVTIILVDSPIFAEKHAVYVYTEAESLTIPGAQRGKGHFDVDVMNMLLQRAVLAYASHTATAPDVLHCQDAHTAILPALAKNDPDSAGLFSRTACVVTIHNAGAGYRQTIPGLTRAIHFTGLPPAVLERALFNGNVEPFLLAADYSTLTTVSPWYAKELTDSQFDHFSEGLSGEFQRRSIPVAGITNGIDYHRYDPRDIACSLLPFSFDPSRGDLAGKYRCRGDFVEWLSSSTEIPGITKFGTLTPGSDSVYFSYHGRIAWQKGLDVLEKSAHIVLDHLDGARFIILGQGDPVLEAMFVRLSQRYSGRLAYVRGYERTLAREAVAISDFIVLPSLFEPCGLEDFIAQIFGTIPVAHAVGGLRKIETGKTGFLYETEGDSHDAAVLARLLLDLAEPIVAASRAVGDGFASSSFGAGCAAVPEYASMIRHAAETVQTLSNWDSIIADQYLPLYRKIQSGLA